MKKSILFILPDLNAGGAERIVTTIANHLSGSEILEQNHDSEAIKNSIKSRFSIEMILEKYFEVFKVI
ncbi:MAG: hypothetical protein WBI92_06430 [Cloacibacterium sp.]|uniref:hypothetical protein n=1 Tax=Cloacibacterium sp. TaxID=1913682 RepID=UPI003C73C19F